MQRARAVLVLAAVVVAHAAYYAWPTDADRAWAFYVFGGVGFVLMALALLPTFATTSGEAGALGVAGCWWAVLEGAQQAGCGAIGWGSAPSGMDLCVQYVGTWPYLVAASLLLARLISAAIHRKSEPPHA